MTKVQRWRSGGYPKTPIFGLVHDLAWAVLAPLVAIMLRNDFLLSPDEVDGTILYLAVSLATAAVVFPLFSMRLDIWEYTSLPDLARVAVAVTVSVVLVSFVMFIVNRHVGVARWVPILHYMILLGALLTARIGYRVIRRDFQNRSVRVRVRRLNPSRREHVLVFGVNRIAEFYANAVSELSDGTVEILGIVSNDERRHGRRLRSHPVLGHAKHLPHFMQEFAVRGIDVDKIVVCAKWDSIPLASQTILRKLEKDGVRVEFIDEMLAFVKRRDDAFDGAADSVAASTQGSVVGLHGAYGADDGAAEVQMHLPAYFRVKRVIDLLVATTLAVVSLPALIAIAILNRVAIGAPVLFWQRRPGQNGAFFSVYKFRTMLAPYDDHGNRIPDDARQTALTRFVRRTRLDELPQLYNIIVGEMSLIGPRPLLPKDQPTGTNARLAIAPGVTGWAQVNGGDLLTPDEKLALDLWYIRHASLWVDLLIVYRTVRTVLEGDKRDEAMVHRAIFEFEMLYPDLRFGDEVTIAPALGEAAKGDDAATAPQPPRRAAGGTG